jgi:hypothetical protein
MSKGTGIRRVLRAAGLVGVDEDGPQGDPAACPSYVVYAGDDAGSDLAAFGALRELVRAGVLDGALCVAVRHPDRVEENGKLLAAADVIVDGVAGAVGWFRGLAEAADWTQQDARARR